MDPESNPALRARGPTAPDDYFIRLRLSPQTRHVVSNPQSQLVMLPRKCKGFGELLPASVSSAACPLASAPAATAFSPDAETNRPCSWPMSLPTCVFQIPPPLPPQDLAPEALPTGVKHTHSPHYAKTEQTKALFVRDFSSALCLSSVSLLHARNSLKNWPHSLLPSPPRHVLAGEFLQ